MVENLRAREAQFRFTFDWSEQEYRKVVRAVTKHQRATGVWKLVRWAGTWGVGVILALNVVIGLLDPSYLVAGLPWVVVFLLFLVLVNGGSAWLQAKRYPEKARGPMSVWVSDEVVGSSSPMSRFETDWSSVERVVETEDFLLFYITDRFASYLPKRLLGPQDLIAIRDLAEAKSRYASSLVSRGV